MKTCTTHHICDCNTEKMIRLEKENDRLKETLSYLPKVPTEPYEKEMAKEILTLKEKMILLEKENAKLKALLAEALNKINGYPALTVDSIINK